MGAVGFWVVIIGLLVIIVRVCDDSFIHNESLIGFQVLESLMAISKCPICDENLRTRYSLNSEPKYIVKNCRNCGHEERYQEVFE